MTNTNNGWSPIDENTPKNNKPILVGFQGQFSWIMWVQQNGILAYEPGYAKPTHYYTVDITAPTGLPFVPSR